MLLIPLIFLKVRKKVHFHEMVVHNRERCKMFVSSADHLLPLLVFTFVQETPRL